MLKLLVPVDGSDSSLHAVSYVIKLAKGNGPVSVHLLSVYSKPVRFGDVGISASPEEMRQFEREQADPALATVERMLREAGVAYEREVRAGEVAATIVVRADQLGCDGIVMGTRGAGVVTTLVMGSVATKVVHLAKVPVTLVK